ncbi:MAG: dTDP-4-dehydrorhamnose reductase [Terracidiphilus sp.]|jgi:dTDP-4-dehydrorhamnose reductase
MSESPTSVANPKENPRILIVGNAGQLGRELEKIFAGFGSIVGVDRESVDLAAPAQTRELVRRVSPDIILNAAAYTAVDRAESERDLAYAINEGAPRVLAEEARKRNAILVHYSTDYVFDGGKSSPWVETDAPGPLNVYGASKLAGERAVENIGGKFLIFRTSWVYGPHGNNFLLTMLRLARERDRLSIVDDQIGGPTTSIELARATHSIVTGILAGRLGAPEDWAGLYHMTCGGSVSWFGFAQAIFARSAEKLAIKPPTLTPISTKDYPTPAARPRYSVLSNAKLHARFGVELSSWESALEETLQALRNAN